MTQTVLIGSSCPLGKLLSSKRFYDYLIDSSNVELLKGKQFGEACLICPSLWNGPQETRQSPDKMIAEVSRLLDILTETKIERLTYVTGGDLLPLDGDEKSPLLVESDNPYLASLINCRNVLNLNYGRVLTVLLPELLGIGDEYSMLGELRQAQATRRKPRVHLLEKHQLYPAERLLKDIDRAWACGMVSVNFATQPVTAFDIVESFFPDLIDKLPISKTSDSAGSDRKSIYSFYWNDPMTGYMMDKEQIIEAVVNDLLAAYGENQGD